MDPAAGLFPKKQPRFVYPRGQFPPANQRESGFAARGNVPSNVQANNFKEYFLE